ncbi:MAG TPA: matrixin family metalloprotease, partial [Polyangiales bacterium]|nr:matrixin family metalloprotease [Polyangiales bacterium]
AVLTHESGHVLGLGESKADPDATMWPYAVPGETQKRTLAQDDEDGVIESYLSKPPAAAGGCGPASVAGKRASHASIVVFMAALVLLAAGSRRRRAALAMLPVLSLTLIVGFGTPRATSDASTQLREQLRAQNDASSADTAAMLRAALRSAEPETRLEAVESLARIGTRDDMALAEELSSDADERIAARAHSALRMLAARAPRASLDARTPEAQARLSRMFDRASRVIAGRAHLTQVIDDDGLLYTEYSVRADDGRETTLRIAGGVRGTIGQRALDGELPPADAQSVVVAEQTDGSVRWAYQQSGRVFGGDLGDGPAIAGAL